MTGAGAASTEGRDTYLTVAETAAFLRKSPKAVYALIERGSLPWVRRIGRGILVNQQDLVHWLNHNCASSTRSRR